MIAIYSRQSVEKIDSISIESQIEFCKSEVRNSQYIIYSDKGYSGKNTNRPEFQRLMNDIRNGIIDTVIVYKLDRISRSILDFSNMMNIFQQHGVTFISYTEKFDTSTPMGMAMLNICIVFAQLERETIQLRVSDAYYSRSEKGFYMGGRVPYGFKREDTVIDGIRTSKYIPVEEEASQLVTIYRMYAQPSITIGAIIRYLTKNNIVKKRDKEWNIARITEILKNPIYVKSDMDVYNFYYSRSAEIVSPPEFFTGTNGCYLYTKKNSRTYYEGHKNMAKYQDMRLVMAPHEGIIDSKTWLACRIKADNNQQVAGGKRANNSWLYGKLKCSRCGLAVRYNKWKGKKCVNEYYLCSTKPNTGRCEGFGTVKKSIIEDSVFEELRIRVSDYKIKNAQQQEENNPELMEIKKLISIKHNEINSLIDKLSSANDTLVKYINNKVQSLDSELYELKAQLAKMLAKSNVGANVDIDKVERYIENWDTLELNEKQRIADTFIKKVFINKIVKEDSIEPEIFIQWII